MRWRDAPLDLGATWIHGIDGNPLTELANRIDAPMLQTSYESSQLYNTSGAVLTEEQQRQLDKLYSQIEDIIEDAQEQDDDQPIQAAIEAALNWSQLSEEDRRLIGLILNSSLEQEYAGSTMQLSSHWFDDAKAFGGEDAFFTQGYQVIVQHLAQGVPIELEQIVQSIDWSASILKVTTDKASYSADRVIITLPLGVLKAGQVAFSPELPLAKRKAIDALGMGVLNKCYLRFAEAFWPTDVDWLEYIPAQTGLWTEWVSFMKSANLPILLGFNAADRGREIESWNDADTIASAMVTLRTIFGPIPDPIDYQLTRWASDPFALGSYSFNAFGSVPKMRDDLAASVDKRLFFAGEGTERKHFSTVHGAYLSGLRVAQEVGDS